MRALLDGRATWPEVTKRLDFTHKRTNHELGGLVSDIGRSPERAESVTAFGDRSLDARDTAASARRLSAAPSASSTTLIDFLAWIGWSAGLRDTGKT